MKSPSRAQEEKSDQADTSATGDQDAVALLKADHRKVEQLFQEYEQTTARTDKISLAARICRELVVHTLLEEEIFYPACREKSVEHKDLDEAQVEHDSAKVLIGELIMERPDDEYYDAKVEVLSEIIKLHVGEEENASDGIFAKAQAAEVDMKALGQRIQARKPQLLGRIEARGFDRPIFRSLHVQTAPVQHQERMQMPRYSRMMERDERGRFVDDDDYRGRGRQWDDDDGYRRGSDRPRDEYGRFMSDDDDDRGRGRGYYRDRDENGRFVSHDERGGMYSSRSRYRDDDNDYRGSYRPRDDEGRFMSGGGRGRQYEDDDREHGGWYGDPRGHAEAARQGRAHRQSGRHYDDDDDRRGRYESRGRYQGDNDRGHGGWYGDPEGHAQAARRGWRDR